MGKLNTVQNGKGSKDRVTDLEKYRNNWEEAFRGSHIKDYSDFKESENKNEDIDQFYYVTGDWGSGVEIRKISKEENNKIDMVEVMKSFM